MKNVTILLVALGACAPSAPRASDSVLCRVGDTPVMASRPYSAVIVWTPAERWFRLCDRLRGIAVETEDFDRFLQTIADLPAHVEIERIDTCTVSRMWGMPDDARRRLDEAMARGQHRWAISGADGLCTMICTCETSGLRRP